MNFLQDLQQNSYPGRGIVLGHHKDGKHAVVAYFIMGRSENSRNRIFTLESEKAMKTEAFDPAKLTDPSLIIYYPMRVLDDVTIVTNGDQTDTVYNFLQNGNTFEAALRTRTFEPDPDNYTPRISGMIDHTSGDYRLSILKSANGDPTSSRRYFFEYNTPKAGVGHFIHTYRCDGDPIPSFEGEPKEICLDGDIDSFANNVWNALNEDNKVSLLVRYIELNTGKTQTVLLNKNQ